MFCTNCGKELAEGTKYCPQCGSPMIMVQTVQKPGEKLSQSKEPTTKPTAEQQHVPSAESKEKTVLENPFSPAAVQNGPTPSMPAYPAAPVALPNEKPNASGLKSQKKFLTILAAISVAFVIALVFVLNWFNAPKQAFNRAVNGADFGTAAEQYERMSASEQDAAMNQLANMAWEALQDYSDGKATYEEVGQWMETLGSVYFPQLKSYDPEIFHMLENLHTSKEHLEKAESAESGGDLPKAISEYEASLAASSKLSDNLGPDTDELNTKIQSIEQKYKSEIIKQAKALADQKDYNGAAALLRESQSVLDGDEEIQSLLNECGDQQTEADISALLETAETKAKTGDYSGAISDLQGSVITDSRITSKLTEYKLGYEKQALEETEELAKSGKYEEAVAKLNQVTTVLGETDALLSKIREYQDLCPVSMTELDAVKGDPVISDKVEADIYGNETSGRTLRFSLWSGNDSSLEYAPNGKFKFLSGKILVSPCETLQGNIKIYADGILKFDQEGLTQKTEPINFEIDIEKAKFVEIEVSGSTGVTDFGYIYLDDPILHN